MDRESVYQTGAQVLPGYHTDIRIRKLIQVQVEEGSQTAGSRADHLIFWIFAPTVFNPLEICKQDLVYCLKRKI